MSDQILLAPSILSADMLNMERDIRRIAAAGADWIHVDVMDGHFVPNLTMGVPLVKALADLDLLPLDVHLMISNPLRQLPWYLEYAPYSVTFHVETQETGDTIAALEMIKAAGSKAALSIKPATPVDSLEPFMDILDMVLVMSVEPGFSGQSYIEDSDKRVAQVRELGASRGRDILVQVDGGINPATAPLVVSAGARSLVCGNAVFKAPDVEAAIHTLKSVAA